MGLLHFVRFHVHPRAKIDYSSYLALEMHFDTSTPRRNVLSTPGVEMGLPPANTADVEGTPNSIPGVESTFRLAVKVPSAHLKGNIGQINYVSPGMDMK